MPPKQGKGVSRRSLFHLIYMPLIIHQHTHVLHVWKWAACTTLTPLAIASILPEQARTHTQWQAGVGFSADVLSVLVICKHHRGIILHNEALQRLPALTSRAKFGSGRNKSRPPPTTPPPLRPPFLTLNCKATFMRLLAKRFDKMDLHHTSFGKSNSTSGGCNKGASPIINNHAENNLD